MNKLFLFTDYYYPITNNTSYYFNKIINHLSKNFENKIEVYSTSISKRTFNVKNNIKSNYVHTGKFNKDNILSRIYNYTKISIKFSIYCIRFVKKDDIVYLNTNPVFLIIFFSLLKRFKKFTLILHCNDIFPENILASGLLKRESIIYKMLLTIYSISYKKIDHFISIGRDMNIVLDLKRDSKSKITFIPYWSNNQTVFPSNKKDNEIIKNYNLNNKIVYLFAGNLGRVQNLHKLLEILKEVKNDNAVFIFIGNGANSNLVQKYCNQKNIFYLGEKNYDDQKIFLNACDISVISLCEKILGFGVPSKIYSYLSVGKPVLYFGPNNSEIYMILNEFKNGWTFNNNQSNSLLEFFNNYENISEINEKSKISLKLSKDIYTEDLILKKYIKLFTQYFKTNKENY